MQPISIFSDIDCIYACNMSHTKTKAGGNILFDVDNSQIDLCDRISLFDTSQIGGVNNSNNVTPRKAGGRDDNSPLKYIRKMSSVGN